MGLILLQETKSAANLADGYVFINELQATSVPTRFGASAHFTGLGSTTGNMELHVEIRTTSNVSFGTHIVTAPRVGMGGTPNRGRIEFEKLFLIPVGCKAKFKIKSLTASDTAVETTLYVYDPNHSSVDAADFDGKSMKQLLQLMAAVLCGKTTGAGTGTEKFRSLNDTADRVTVTVNSQGDRTGVSYTG
jgi:hypothetical protein